MDVGVPELLIILAVLLLLFGSKKLPDLARGLGQSAKEFRKGSTTRATPPRTSPPRSTRAGSPDVPFEGAFSPVRRLIIAVVARIRCVAGPSSDNLFSTSRAKVSISSAHPRESLL